jgi:transcriptional regulator with XRE-family HTH domain
MCDTFTAGRVSVGGKVPDQGSPTVRRRRLAAELHRLRDRAGLTGDQVAERLGWSPSKISRIENTRSGLKVQDARKLLDIYGVQGAHRDELLTLAQDAERKGWWESYAGDLPEELVEFIGMEAEAASAWNWEPLIVPGLLQTESYAREVIGNWQEFFTIPPSAIERRIQARSARQHILTQEEDPLNFLAVLDESVLLRQFGDAAVMRNQLEHLISVSKLDNVTLRILRLGGYHPIGTGSFVYLKFPPAYDLTDLVVVEQFASSYYVKEAADIFQYELAFRALVSSSLDPEESRDLISSVISQNWS